MENTILKKENKELIEKQERLIQYLDELNKRSIYSLNDFVEVFNDPSILEGVDVREIIKERKS